MTEVRPVQDEDFEAVAAIANAYVATTPIHFLTTPVPADEMKTTWRDTDPRFPFLVAEERGAVAGFARASPFREKAGYRFTAEVGLYVDKNRRRGGIGRALYAALLDACAANGFGNVVAAITLPNEASVQLHEAMGFQKVGHFPQIGFKSGAWHDVGFWQRTLGTPAHPDEVTTP